MAYRRSIAKRLNLYAQHRFSPSFSYLHHEDDRKNRHSDEKVKGFVQSRSFGSYISTGASNGLLGFGGRRCSQFFDVPMTASGIRLARNMSTAVGDGAAAEKIEYMADMADVLADKTMEVVANQAPAVSEVAIAAADSWLPVAALQYAIDGIHTFTGLNWWASIVVATVVIRTLTIPLMINQLKATSKLTILRPELEAIKKEMDSRGMNPSAVAESQERMQRIFREHGVSPFTPMKGLLIQGPVFLSFFLAIQNMADKVPSFKTGGAYWFLDLTTPDPTYCLPVLTALTFWITVESNMQEGMEGNPAAKTMKNVSRGFAALMVPLTLTFQKALFCYWLTSNVFSLVYGLIIKQESVKKLLNIPIIVPPPPSTHDSEPSFSFFGAMKKFAEAQAEIQRKAGQTNPMNQRPTSTALVHQKPAIEEQKPTTTKISPATVLSHRIRNLEKKVKGKKKDKKR